MPMLPSVKARDDGGQSARMRKRQFSAELGMNLSHKLQAMSVEVKLVLHQGHASLSVMISIIMIIIIII